VKAGDVILISPAASGRAKLFEFLLTQLNRKIRANLCESVFEPKFSADETFSQWLFGEKL
jgi:hypothetical protein